MICMYILLLLLWLLLYVVVWMNLSLGTKTSRQRMTELASCPPTRWDDIFSVNLRRNHGTAPDQDVNLIVAMAYNWRRKCNEKKLIIKFSKKHNKEQKKTYPKTAANVFRQLCRWIKWSGSFHGLLCAYER